MVHVEDDAEKIAARRSQDRDRVRPVRSEEILEKHQRLSRKLCEAYASALDTEMLVCALRTMWNASGACSSYPTKAPDCAVVVFPRLIAEAGWSVDCSSAIVRPHVS